MPRLRVAIAGATGYGGEELLRLLCKHPHVQLTYLAASAKWDRPSPVSEVFPRFARQLDLPIEALDPGRLSTAADAVFLALPHGVAKDLLPGLLKAGKRVIDLSGDFRLRDPSLYPRWYAYTHPAPELLARRDVVYGLTEFHREEIRQAAVVANPGCYATSVLLAVLPLFQRKLVKGDRVLVDAKSGLSGAGRTADPALLFTEMSENLRAYKVHEHQHMPEMLQEIAAVTGHQPRLGFVPQVIPVTRGLISTVYVDTDAGADEIAQAYAAAYPEERTPFVRVRPGTLPELRDVVETNYCDVGFVAAPPLGVLTIGSALDNLTKGAAGQAVQNFNLMFGFPETTALL